MRPSGSANAPFPLLLADGSDGHGIQQAASVFDSFASFESKFQWRSAGQCVESPRVSTRKCRQVFANSLSEVTARLDMGCNVNHWSKATQSLCKLDDNEKHFNSLVVQNAFK